MENIHFNNSKANKVQCDYTNARLTCTIVALFK